MTGTGVILSVFMLMQAVNPLLGTFQPLRPTPAGDVTINSGNVSFASGIALETVTESGGPYQSAMVMGGASGSASGSLSPAPAESSGYMELRRIERHTGAVRDLCDGRIPTHVVITTFPDGLGVGFIRKTLFSTRRCQTLLYRRDAAH
jgi:hypothetical protein